MEKVLNELRELLEKAKEEEQQWLRMYKGSLEDLYALKMYKFYCGQIVAYTRAINKIEELEE